MKILFWLAAGFIGYAYFGYGLLVGLIAWARRRTSRKADITPRVSLIVTVHNEQKRIEDKLENSLAHSYPPGRIEIIVASDCSSDGTDEIVRSFAARGVRLVRSAERKGKESAQKLAIAHATGEILVFSDVGTILPPQGIATIVRNFADPTVGCVTSVDRVIDAEGRGSGEGVYVKYEMLLRRLETLAGSVVGLSGSFFAVRRELCTNWATDIPSDFTTLLNSVRLGLRGVSDPESIGYYRAVVDESREFERKVRTVVRGIAALMRNREMLNPFRYGLFAWQLWSHKVCRWFVPFAMLVAFAGNVILAGERLYAWLLVLQVAFYAAALMGMTVRSLAAGWVIRIPTFFVLVNLSIASAWYRYASGERMVSWTPSER